MAVITETALNAQAQAKANGHSNSVGKIKLNGHVNGNASSSATAAPVKEAETKLVDPFNYVVSEFIQFDREFDGRVTAYRFADHACILIFEANKDRVKS